MAQEEYRQSLFVFKKETGIRLKDSEPYEIGYRRVIKFIKDSGTKIITFKSLSHNNTTGREQDITKVRRIAKDTGYEVISIRRIDKSYPTGYENFEETIYTFDGMMKRKNINANL
jgi:hypothetical protein